MATMSHKKDNGENIQIRSAKPIGTTYGEEKGNHPNRRGWEAMDRHEAQLKAIAAQKLEAARRGGY